MKAAIMIQTPVGEMVLVEENGALVMADFCNETPKDATMCETPLLARAKNELCEYFDGSRQSFDLPLAPKGTVFQRRCWDTLLTIPYGETVSYGEQAARIGNPRACRAVGMANHHNPIVVIIPCHRAIGKNGSLVGYGSGLETKKALLALEASVKQRIKEA